MKFRKNKLFKKIAILTSMATAVLIGAFGISKTYAYTYDRNTGNLISDNLIKDVYEWDAINAYARRVSVTVDRSQGTEFTIGFDSSLNSSLLALPNFYLVSASGEVVFKTVIQSNFMTFDIGSYTSSDTFNLQINVNGSANDWEVLHNNIMLNRGSTLKPYEPYDSKWYSQQAYDNAYEDALSRQGSVFSLSNVEYFGINVDYDNTSSETILILKEPNFWGVKDYRTGNILYNPTYTPDELSSEFGFLVGSAVGYSDFLINHCHIERSQFIHINHLYFLFRYNVPQQLTDSYIEFRSNKSTFFAYETDFPYTFGGMGSFIDNRTFSTNLDGVVVNATFNLIRYEVDITKTNTNGIGLGSSVSGSIYSSGYTNGYNDASNSYNAQYYTNGYNAGYDNGYNSGYAEGAVAGNDVSYQEGYNLGYANGSNASTLGAYARSVMQKVVVKFPLIIQLMEKHYFGLLLQHHLKHLKQYGMLIY